ncbi:MAG: hypothetical protein NTV29_17265 [Planctomycetota bacterium]|nr:hypothetical protein [Planctomycetota bacterium]
MGSIDGCSLRDEWTGGRKEQTDPKDWLNYEEIPAVVQRLATRIKEKSA